MKLNFYTLKYYQGISEVGRTLMLMCKRFSSEAALDYAKKVRM